MCPEFAGVGMLGCGHATGSDAVARSSYSIGVSIPSEECRRRRLWKISRYSNRNAHEVHCTPRAEWITTQGPAVRLRMAMSRALVTSAATATGGVAVRELSHLTAGLAW
jgi:hypothetical protein